ncbi:hypothetical protein HDU67_003897 [Dinochytrium kinnereticum]|nr:hypothetical protein HDU67_003897 [Dinochytrium kinnereticum]
MHGGAHQVTDLDGDSQRERFRAFATAHNFTRLLQRHAPSAEQRNNALIAASNLERWEHYARRMQRARSEGAADTLFTPAPTRTQSPILRPGTGQRMHVTSMASRHPPHFPPRNSMDFIQQVKQSVAQLRQPHRQGIPSNGMTVLTPPQISIRLPQPSMSMNGQPSHQKNPPVPEYKPASLPTPPLTGTLLKPSTSEPIVRPPYSSAIPRPPPSAHLPGPSISLPVSTTPLPSKPPSSGTVPKLPSTSSSLPCADMLFMHGKILGPLIKLPGAAPTESDGIQLVQMPIIALPSAARAGEPSSASRMAKHPSISLKAKQPSISLTKYSSARAAAQILKRGYRGQTDHVSIACIHCKKAGKKCSIERPCSRCIRLCREGCVDAPRKPRLIGFKRGPYQKKFGVPKEGKSVGQVEDNNEMQDE